APRRRFGDRRAGEAAAVEPCEDGRRGLASTRRDLEQTRQLGARGQADLVRKWSVPGCRAKNLCERSHSTSIVNRFARALVRSGRSFPRPRLCAILLAAFGRPILLYPARSIEVRRAYPLLELRRLEHLALGAERQDP